MRPSRAKPGANKALATRGKDYVDIRDRYPGLSLEEAYKQADKDRKKRFRLRHRSRLLDEWRKTMQIPENRAKLRCRHKSRRAVKRGQLTPKPCEVCGDPNSEKHHPDYSDFKKVIWLCKLCHAEVHHV